MPVPSRTDEEAMHDVLFAARTPLSLHFEVLSQAHSLIPTQTKFLASVTSSTIFTPMDTAIRTASADHDLENGDAAGRVRYVQLIEVSVVIALCSYFYLKWRGRKKVRYS
jgi:hypothetical protein